MFLVKTFWQEPLTIHLFCEVLVLIATFVFSIINLIVTVITFDSDRNVLLQLVQVQQYTTDLTNLYGTDDPSNLPQASGGSPVPYSLLHGVNSTTVNNAQDYVQSVTEKDLAILILTAVLSLVLIFRISVMPWYMIVGAKLNKHIQKMDEYTPLGMVKKNVAFRRAFIIQVVIYTFIIAALGVAMLIINVNQLNLIFTILWGVTVVSSIIALTLSGIQYRTARAQLRLIKPSQSKQNKFGNSATRDSFESIITQDADEKHVSDFDRWNAVPVSSRAYPQTVSQQPYPQLQLHLDQHPDTDQHPSTIPSYYNEQQAVQSTKRLSLKRSFDTSHDEQASIDFRPGARSPSVARSSYPRPSAEHHPGFI